jgi:integrase
MKASMKVNPLELWLGKVYLGKSKSKNTRENYERFMQQFLDYAGVTAEQIIQDYPKQGNDRTFKQKWADTIFMWMNELDKKDSSPLTIRTKVGAVQSFFKYHNLSLGMIQVPMNLVKFHNRDITKEEISMIMKASRPRYRAFYSFMAQSGIRPYTIMLLRLKHLEPDWGKGIVPCRVQVPQELAKGKYGAYFSFIGEETIEHLKGYFATRPNMTSESLLFCKAGHENEEWSTETVSGEFNRVIRALKEQGRLSFEVRKDKPSELRLYALRKFFKKYSQQAGEEFNEFWMGHKGKGVTDAYRPGDIEFHRQLYQEKAMPFLRIESPTPTETELTIMKLKKQLVEQGQIIQRLDGFRERIKKLEDALTQMDQSAKPNTDKDE